MDSFWASLLASIGILWVVIIAAFVFAYFLGLYTVHFMALERGRNALGWTILSLLTTPLIGMLFLACLGETEEHEEWRIYQEEIIREKARKREKI